MQFLNYRNYGRLWRVYGKSLLRYGSVKKIANAFRTEIAYRRHTVDVRSAPYILFLEPLYYCNLDCPLCDRQVFPTARANDAGRLTLELYDRILDEVGDYLFQCQIFGQGEPMLDWPLTRQIIERSHRRRIFTLVSTNCTLITPTVAQEVVACGLDHLVCAIDGISQESYALYRVGGKVEEALNGLRAIVEQKTKQRSKMEIEWQFLVHAKNAHEIDEARKLADELGVVIRFAPLRGMEWDRELESFWLGDGSHLIGQPMQKGQIVNPWSCYFLWRSLVLNSNGKVARCLIYQNVSQYANLHTDSVLSAYNHPSVQRARELYRKGEKPTGESPEPCASCAYFERHHGHRPVDRRTPLRVLEQTAGR
jgi:sulfatase maturation enzyme AslB (radical SAM superfamily)